MRCSVALLLFLLALGLGSCAAPLVPVVHRVPSMPTEERMSALRQGMVLYEKGNYDGALAIYNVLLEQDPDDVSALYELGSTCIAQGKLEQARWFALRGAEYYSPYLYRFYAMMASIEEGLGDHEKAAALYNEALAREPNDYWLHYSLGVLYSRYYSRDSAIAQLERAALLNANHASSHYLLGMMFFQKKRYASALFALGRFLVLEPVSNRAEIAYSTMELILKNTTLRRVSAANDVSTFLLSFDLNDSVYTAANTALPRAREHAVATGGTDEAAIIAEQFNAVVSVLVERDAKRAEPYTDMVHIQYVPYYHAVQQYGYTLPFVYHILQKQAVIRKHMPAEQQEKIRRFLQWSDAYTHKR